MGWWRRQHTAVVLVLLFSTSLWPGVLAEPTADENVDLRLDEVQLEAGEVVSFDVVLEQDRFAVIAWRCSECDVSLESPPEGVEANLHGTQMMSAHSDEETTLQLTARSEISETMTLMRLVNVEDVQTSNRPSPNADVDSTPVGRCPVASDCLNVSSGSLATVVDLNNNGFLQQGVALSSNDHHLVFDVLEGDSLEWQWLASTHDVAVEMYHQTTSGELLLNGTHRSGEAHAEVGDTPQQPGYWVAPEDGRFVARLSTEAVRAIWAANVVVHPHAPFTALLDTELDQGARVVGHHSTIATFDWPEFERLKLNAPVGHVEISVDQLWNGAWVAGSPMLLRAGEEQIVYPYPDAEGGRLIITNTSAFAVDASFQSFADLEQLEAPSFRPEGTGEDNASWPVINLTSTTEGEFTLSVHDTVDTYRLVVDGWAESIHFVQFVLTGDIAGLELQLWDIDQTTGEVINTDITRPIGEQLKIGLQVGRGTHYLQLRYQNASEATPHLWGEDVEGRTYALQASYSLIDEGEQPWFPPSDEAVFWGSVARWFMGILFLLPVVYLAIYVKRSKTFAASVAAKKQRLAWYVERLDRGESSVKEARTDLAKALRAVAQLDWQDGLEAWGPKRLEHRTEDLALAVWSVDERMATVAGAWPVVVGVHVLNGTWDLAALRFDAPDGEAFEVVGLEPRFLFQGEEVFLDTMGPGHSTYLMAELNGSAQRVDVELNGRMDGVPFAARVPETLERN